MPEPIIEQLTKSKAENEAKIKTLEHEVYLLKVQNKSIDKAIKALTPETK